MHTNRFAFALTFSVVLFNFAANVAAQDPLSVTAPQFAVGDRWVWNVKDNTSLRMQAKGCSAGYPSGAQEVETVTAISDIGYVTEILGPMPNSRYSRTYLNDGTYRGVWEGKELRAGPLRFPLRPGNTWEATWAGTQVSTTLTCQAEAPERMVVGKEELTVIPITCNGKWQNRQGNGDVAEYKYWYSPVVGRPVRHTGHTYAWGENCFDAEWRLENYTRSK